jgi:hypothetical protein
MPHNRCCLTEQGEQIGKNQWNNLNVKFWEEKEKKIISQVSFLFVLIPDKIPTRIMSRQNLKVQHFMLLYLSWKFVYFCFEVCPRAFQFMLIYLLIFYFYARKKTWMKKIIIWKALHHAYYISNVICNLSESFFVCFLLLRRSNQAG